MVKSRSVDLSDTQWYLSASRGDLNLYFADTFLKVVTPESEAPEIAIVEAFRRLKPGVSAASPYSTTIGSYTPTNWYIGDSLANAVAELSQPLPAAPSAVISDGDAYDNPEGSESDEGEVSDDSGQEEFGDMAIKLSTQKGSQEFPLEAVNISFAFPEVGLYNYKNGCVFFQRTTERQNKKGLCSATGKFIGVLDHYYNYFSFPSNFRYRNQFNWKLTTLNQVLINENTMDFDEAYKNVKRLRSFARAFDRNFFIAQGTDSPNPDLWFRRTLVGSIISNKKVSVRNTAFLPEVADFFIPRGLDVDEAN